MGLGHWPRRVTSSLKSSSLESHCPCRVGPSLTGGTPPGTVRAPLDAYGSTSETAEGHILQRGLGVVPAVARVQRDVRPTQHQAEVPPVVVATHMFRVLDRDICAQAQIFGAASQAALSSVVAPAPARTFKAALITACPFAVTR